MLLFVTSDQDIAELKFSILHRLGTIHSDHCACCLSCHAWLLTAICFTQGFAELEYGILRWMGAIDENTPVVCTIHDCQLLEEEIDPAQMLEHDVPVDIIVTPTQVGQIDS